MDKLRMESPDITAQNIDRIAALFPNCITEMLDEEHSNVVYVLRRHIRRFHA